MPDGSRDDDRPRRPPPERDDRNGPDTAGTADTGPDPDARDDQGGGPVPDDRGDAVARLRWLWTTDHAWVAFARETLISVAVVFAIGLLLFGISGIWPPMVAVESTSMQPHLGVGDLVFVVAEDRLVPRAAHGETGVVTAHDGAEAGYRKFGRPGDVVVYRPDGRARATPIIHRAMLWVNDSENWYDEADPNAVGGHGSCESLPNCPAPHDGFITKGDNEATNGAYDQVNGLSAPVRPAWVVGTAQIRVPFLGYVKLCTSGGPCPLSVVAADSPPPPGSGLEPDPAPAPGTGSELDATPAPTPRPA